MAQNVTIAGASYLGVPRIEMPKTGGGTAVFVDTSDANAAAGDITKGKTAYVGGTKITGTLETSSVSVQPSKALTITSNGTVSVTPDAPYDALSSVDVTVDVASGGGGGAGFKVTFPATAKNWDRVDTSTAYILLADGTTKSVINYSTIGGKTIENVSGIMVRSLNPFFVLRMTLSEGGIAQINITGDSNSYVVTTAPNATLTPYSLGRELFWWPVADTVISAIEMYNTD